MGSSDPTGLYFINICVVSQMKDSIYLEKKINNTTLIWDSGCLLTELANQLSTITGTRFLATDISNKDIFGTNKTKEKYDLDCIDPNKFGKYAATLGLSADYWTKIKQDQKTPNGFMSKILELFNDPDRGYTVAAKISAGYTSDKKTFNHWIGIDTILAADEMGILWAVISPSSENDMKQAVRHAFFGNNGWKYDDSGRMLVDVSKIQEIRTLEKPAPQQSTAEASPQELNTPSGGGSPLDTLKNIGKAILDFITGGKK